MHSIIKVDIPVELQDPFKFYNVIVLVGTAETSWQKEPHLHVSNTVYRGSAPEEGAWVQFKDKSNNEGRIKFSNFYNIV